jgi:uncharacterized membrane protein
MTRYPIGMIALIIVSVLVYFGLAHRVLDRMRLTDRAALVILGALFVGSFIDIPIPVRNVESSINVGGFFIPVGLAIYVLSKAGTSKEVIRTIFATIATAGAVYLINRFIISGDPWQTGRDFIDPLYMYPLVAGGIAYLVGRTRRGAFIAAILGVLILDLINFIYLVNTGTRGTVALGGAGAFDVIVLSGIFAVLLAEIVGESIERLQGGPKVEGRPEDLIEGLQSPSPAGKPLRVKNNEDVDKDETGGDKSDKEL